MGCARSSAVPPRGLFGEANWPVRALTTWTRTSGYTTAVPNISVDFNGIQRATAVFTSRLTNHMMAELHFADGHYTAKVSSKYSGSLPGAITLERLDSGGQIFLASTFKWDWSTRVLKLTHDGVVVLTTVDYNARVSPAWGEHCVYVFPGDVPQPKDEKPPATYPADPCWAVCNTHRDWSGGVAQEIAKGNLYMNSATIADQTRLYAAIVFTIASVGRWHVAVKDL